MLFVGLDIGGTNLKAGILDWDTGELVGRPKEEALPKDSKGRETEAVVDRLVALAQSLLDQQGITWQDILHVGVACPGQIDRKAGIVVGASTFPSWSNVPLANLVQNRTGRPATILNDASAAASAEFAGRGSQETIAVLTLGTGIGLGVVCAGRVVNGARGLVEGGHMIVEPGPEGRLCGCGQRGCLEAYASASAVAAIASERLGGVLTGSTTQTAGLSPSGESEVWGSPSRHPPDTPTLVDDDASPGGGGTRRRNASLHKSDSAVSLRIMEFERRVSAGEKADKVRSAPVSPSIQKAMPVSPGLLAGGLDGRALGGPAEVTAVDVFAMAKQGDEIAIKVVEETCDYLGLACVNICRILDPDAILLAGGMPKAEGLVDKVRDAFLRRGWDVLPHECEISSSVTGAAAGVVGAAGAAASEYALAKRRHRRKTSGEGSVDMELTAEKGARRRSRAGWGTFLAGVGVGAVVMGVAAVSSSRRGVPR